MRLQITLAIFLFFNISFSQEYKLGKVTEEELLETKHPTDTSAVAAYKFKTGYSRFILTGQGSWMLETDVNVKIKIYTKEGLDKANKEVSYYVGGNTAETINFSDAYTYNLVEGKIERTRLKNEGEFKVEVNENWREKKIVMPAVQVGSIVEYSYKLRSPHITRINDWFFQEDIPVDFVKYTIDIPSYFRYSTVITGFEIIDTSTENFSTLEYGGLRSIYSKTNMPAIKEESYVNNIKNYTSVLKYELASISYPNQSVQNLALDWDAVTKQIYDESNFGRELKFNSYFEEDLEPLLKDVTTRDEKIKVILNFVKQRMTWNDKNRIFCEDGVKKAYKNRVGNSAEINLMLIAMLRYAGLDANPVLVSTKSNGIAFFPNRTAFNYVIAAVEIPNDLILLDAISSNSYFNILPIKVLNWRGRLIRNSGSSTEVDLMPKIVSNDVVNVIAEIDENGLFKGKLREQYFDYVAFIFRENNSSLKKNDDFVEKIEAKHKGIKIKDFEIKGVDKLDEPVVETFSFEHSNLIEKIGDKMYFSPLIFFEKTENPFKQEVRKYPVDYTIPYSDNFRIMIKIPDGFEVVSSPEPINLQMENNQGSFLFNIAIQNNSIQISSIFNINTTLIASSEYATLKMFYKKMIEKQSEKIVIVKKL